MNVRKVENCNIINGRTGRPSVEEEEARILENSNSHCGALIVLEGVIILGGERGSQ